MSRTTPRALAAALAGFVWASAAADRAFVLIEKGVEHRQEADGTLTALEYHFVGETVGKPGGGVNVHAVWRRSDDGSFVAVARREAPDLRIAFAYPTQATLDAAFPDGTYRSVIETVGAGPMEFVLSLGGVATAPRLPGPIAISLVQDGAAVAPDRIDPHRPLTVGWSPFESGRTDPAGIMDDLVFAVIKDCRGATVVRSALPMPDQRFLTFRDERFSIAAGTLAPGAQYAIEVIHVDGVDTRRNRDVIAMATYNARTTLRLRAAGERAGSCP